MRRYTRNSLHIRDDSGQITDFHPLEKFETLEDVDEVLTLNEAIVECITDRFKEELFGIRQGKNIRQLAWIVMECFWLWMIA